MLAYLFWHRALDGTEPTAYESAVEHFHRSLHGRPPDGFAGSASYRTTQLPWLPGAYEDWYLVEDFAALGVLNQAAVARGHRTVHEQAARHMGAGAGGLYGLIEGHAELSAATLAVWVSCAPRASPPGLAALLGDGMDAPRASLWQRQLVLGPAPEFCLLAAEPPRGVAPSRLPRDWSTTVSPRELLWSG